MKRKRKETWFEKHLVEIYLVMFMAIGFIVGIIVSLFVITVTENIMQNKKEYCPIQCETYDVKSGIAESQVIALDQSFEPEVNTAYKNAVRTTESRCVEAVYTDEDLFWLALTIYKEAGASWLSESHKLLVGNVVLNRVESDEFPDTIYDVVHQDGQYPFAQNWNFEQPSVECLVLAQRLLEGERVCPKDVVYQANFIQGDKIYKVINDEILGSTYFCS